ncbi:MAG: hypothetical protein ACFFDI_30770, partial [Promethearchaeota archaeon]
MNKCKFCQNEYEVSEVQGFCSRECEMQHNKATFTTLSIKIAVRNRILLLQNNILKSCNRKIGYSDLIDHIFDLVEDA